VDVRLTVAAVSDAAHTAAGLGVGCVNWCRVQTTEDCAGYRPISGVAESSIIIITISSSSSKV